MSACAACGVDNRYPSGSCKPCTRKRAEKWRQKGLPSKKADAPKWGPRQIPATPYDDERASVTVSLEYASIMAEHERYSARMWTKVSQHDRVLVAEKAAAKWESMVRRLQDS